MRRRSSIDGASANDERGSNGLALGGGGAAEFNGASPTLISTEAIQEFAIITSGADATFGRGSGGQVNVQTIECLVRAVGLTEFNRFEHIGSFR